MAPVIKPRFHLAHAALLSTGSWCELKRLMSGYDKPIAGIAQSLRPDPKLRISAKKENGRPRVGWLAEYEPTIHIRFSRNNRFTYIFYKPFGSHSCRRYGHSAKPAEGRRRVPADQSKTSPCQIIDRLKTTDDQVERVPASGR